MAFRKKAQFILTENPDILVVPECEHPDKLKFADTIRKPTDTLWFGTNQNKGIGIFSYGQYKLKLLKKYNPDFKSIIPITVTGKKSKFILFAIWANNPLDPDGTYVEQVWKAMAYYEHELKKAPVVLIGDFNSNTIWDRPGRIGNHSDVVQVLKEKDIHSTYHKHFKQKQGQEQYPTFYLYRHQDKPYHLDYCFVSKELMAKLKSVAIGAHEYWMQYSDHVPVIVTFK